MYQAKAKMIGYWNDKHTQGFIDPHKLVIVWDEELKHKVVAYLEAGKECNHQKGPSKCRFCNEFVGSCEKTDGVWMWPEGLPHYIEEHNISLPEGFLAYIKDNNFVMDVKKYSTCSLDFWRAYCKGYKAWN